MTSTVSWMFDTATPPARITSCDWSSGGKNFGSAPNTSCPVFCRSSDTPIAVISGASRPAARSGRYAIRSIAAPSSPQATIDSASTTTSPNKLGALAKPSACAA